MHLDNGHTRRNAYTCGHLRAHTHTHTHGHIHVSLLWCLSDLITLNSTQVESQLTCRLRAVCSVFFWNYLPHSLPLMAQPPPRELEDEGAGYIYIF